MCIVHFTNKKQQEKAFNYLIHSGIGFVGIAVHTIKLKEKDYQNLKAILDEN